MGTLSRPLTLGCASVLIGCTSPEIPRQAIPDDADSVSRAYLGLVIAGRTDSAARSILIPANAPNIRPVLEQLSTLLQGAILDSARVVGAHTFRVSFPDAETRRRVRMSYEIRSANGWRLATVSSVDTAGALRIEGLRVDTLAAPLAELNAFTLAGKSPKHYLWLVGAVVASATCVGTAVLVAAARAMPRRWVWTVLSAFGVAKFSLDWTTGAVGIMPIAVQFLGAGYQRAPPVGPWIVSFSLPLFAMVALWRRRRWIHARKVEASDSATSAA